MPLTLWQLRGPTSRRRRSWWRRHRTILGAGAGVLSLAIVWFLVLRSSGDQPIPLAASPSPQLLDAVTGDVIDFPTALVRSIQQHGGLTATVHVALADQRAGGVPTKFGDGDKPESNMHWGARYGVETFLTQAGGWRRVYADDGDGRQILRRVVLNRRTEATPAWQARGVAAPFDIYVLANAWRASAVTTAMRQPLRDALAGETVRLTVDGRAVDFGLGSVLCGYVGPNGLAETYVDLLDGLPAGPADRQAGVFYISPMSAVYLHRPVIDHGLYSMLFVRREVVPEAYTLKGLLDALAAGDLDDGFVAAAAEEYSRHQKNCTPDQARFLFCR